MIFDAYFSSQHERKVLKLLTPNVICQCKPYDMVESLGKKTSVVLELGYVGQNICNLVKEKVYILLIYVLNHDCTAIKNNIDHLNMCMFQWQSCSSSNYD